MGATKKDASKQIVVGGAGAPWWVRHRRYILGGLVLLVLAAGIAWLVYAAMRNQEADPYDLTAEQQTMRAAVVRADRLKYQGKVDAAVQELLRAKQQTDKKEIMAMYDMQLGALYESDRQFDKAMEYYRAIEAAGLPSFRTEAPIARCAEAMGDKETALKYYKLAYEAVDTNIPGYQAKHYLYKSKVEELGGSL
ncbi:hypothetical protein CR970_01665 [Candidatus Saccharibacteria bacterium]|nr:MAG: hypothetical protein CR970_01665 [Candidatus Saccharibacteria bacterium]